MSQPKSQSTGEPSDLSQTPQRQEPEAPKPSVEKGPDTITHKALRTLTFPTRIHPRQKKFQPSAEISVVSKEVATANYERDTFLKAGIKVEESCGENKDASGFLLDETATAAGAGMEPEEREKMLPRIPEEVFRKEDLKALWRRYVD